MILTSNGFLNLLNTVFQNETITFGSAFQDHLETEDID